MVGKAGDWGASPASGPAHCIHQVDPCSWHQSPICLVTGLDSVISQAPSSSVPSSLSYDSLDMAFVFKGMKLLLVKHLLGQEEFQAVFHLDF